MTSSSGLQLGEFVVLNKTSLNVLALDFSPRLLWSKNLLMEPMTAILFAPPAMPHTKKKLLRIIMPE